MWQFIVSMLVAMYKCPIVRVWYIQSRQYQYRHISHRTQQTAEYWGRQTSKISSSHLMTPWEKKVQYWENTEVRRQRTKCSRPATLRHPFQPPEPRLYEQSTCLIKGYSFGVTPVCDFFFSPKNMHASLLSLYPHTNIIGLNLFWSIPAVLYYITVQNNALISAILLVNH